MDNNTISYFLIGTFIFLGLYILVVCMRKRRDNFEVLQGVKDLGYMIGQNYPAESQMQYIPMQGPTIQDDAERLSLNYYLNMGNESGRIEKTMAYQGAALNALNKQYRYCIQQ